ncbi:MAG: type I methionyl aminopeptidase [Candidatus Omnitrophica bacterium]|nr:type I methionyl aminopeptidase [Candidatus Omnitrophota bacterium]
MITLKSPSEIEKLQESADLVSEVQNQMIALAEPGLPTIELDRLAEKVIRDAGAQPVFKGYRGFPFTVCISINEEVVHGFPSKRKLKEGDIVSMDVGARYQGYVGDCARTIAIGSVAPEEDSLIRQAYHALREACKVVQVGKRLGDVSHTVERIARQFNYGVVQDFVGHGVGREMHEDPQVPNFGRPGTGQRLKAGLVICIEPMFNLGTYEVEILEDRWTVVTKDRRKSVHVEDMVALLPDGPRVLSSADGAIYPDDVNENSNAVSSS